MGQAIDTLKLRPEIQQMLLTTRRCLNCGTYLKRGHGFKRTQGFCSATCYFAKSPRMAWLERQYGMPIRDIVMQTLNRSSTTLIAAELLGISKHTLYQWIEKLGIKQVQRWE